MELIKLIFTHHKRQFLWMLILTLLSGAIGIAVLMYINHYLLQLDTTSNSHIIFYFFLLVIAYLLITTVSQIKLSAIGHQFLLEMQTQLLKRILDTSAEQVQVIGKPKLLASLSHDIRILSFAFTRLPELVQGVLFVLASSLYLVYLSPKLFLVIAAFLLIMTCVSNLAVKKHYSYFKKMRQTEDTLYQHYETGLFGHKELSLNRHRSERFYQEDFLNSVEQKRASHIRADAFHLFAVNWSNTMMLALVGVIFYLALYLQWASLAEAISICMIVLFMRAPLSAAIGAFPLLMQSKVSLEVLRQFDLHPYTPSFHQTAPIPQDWTTIRLENISYHYSDDKGFSLRQINLTLKRGETVFLIGENGSGKSTLSLILTGLYRPSSGKIYVDDIEITDDNRQSLRQLFSSVFTDFYLFEKLLNEKGENANITDILQWLTHLQLDKKVHIENSQILNSNLSQGQKKRLGLLIATLEKHPVLLLDEWAADQDPHYRRVFYEELIPRLKANNQTIFAISHDDKYFHHADRILSMKSGELSEYNAQNLAI